MEMNVSGDEEAKRYVCFMYILCRDVFLLIEDIV